MKLRLKRNKFKDNWINIFQNRHLILGFTESGFAKADLSKRFKEIEILELNQVHSGIIFLSENITKGQKGDGILLTEKGRLAIIKTADCIPLFFWHKKYLIAGIIHVGWKGLLAGIEKELIKVLKKNNFKISQLQFLIGPSICRECYEVSSDLYTTFYNFPDRGKIFSSKNTSKYYLDLKKGLALSLINHGVLESNIIFSNICNHCNDKFPSYRTNQVKTGRIFNFIMLSSSVNYTKQ